MGGKFAKRALQNFSWLYLKKFFVQGFQSTFGLWQVCVCSLCLLDKLQSFAWASAVIMFFALTSFQQKNGHQASSICKAQDKYYCLRQNEICPIQKMFCHSRKSRHISLVFSPKIHNFASGIKFCVTDGKFKDYKYCKQLVLPDFLQHELGQKSNKLS